MGTTPWLTDLFRSASGLDMVLISSFNILGCNSSGPQDLFTFMSLIFSSIISLVMNRSQMEMSVRRSNLGIPPSRSLVKTLQNCFWRIFAFSSLLNFIDFLSLAPSSKSEAPVFVFNLLLICDQNTLGYCLHLSAISLSYFRFDCRIKFVTLFLALV